LFDARVEDWRRWRSTVLALQTGGEWTVSTYDYIVFGGVSSKCFDSTVCSSGTGVTSSALGWGLQGGGFAAMVTDSVFIGAEIRVGGPLSTYMMSDSTVTDVTTSFAGVYVRAGTDGEIRRSTITNTTGPTSFTSIGGALFVEGAVRLIDSEISNNTSYSHAGVHVAEEGAVEIVNSIVSGNIAQNQGGGIGILEGGHLWMVNSLVVGNEAFTGAGIHSNRGVASIVNSTISGNTPHPTSGTAGIYHGAFNAPLATMEVRNSSVHGNAPGFANVTGSSGLTIEYSNIEGGFVGTGNIDADPQFIDADYRVASSSPAVDAGDPVAGGGVPLDVYCLLYTSPSPRDRTRSRMPSSA